MNRNQMYDYLKSIGMFALSVHHNAVRGRRKSYHIEFRANQETHQSKFTIITDWGYIRGCSSIHLCMNEIVIESDFGDCKINISYKNIEKFEVRMDEID